MTLAVATWGEKGFGWQRDLPDSRDFSIDTPEVRSLLERLRCTEETELPTAVDLREFFPPAYDQAGLNSSTSQVCVGLTEYFERRAHGNMVRLSRLFHYHTTRHLLRTKGNVATDLRSGFKAQARFGLPPEQFCRYDVDKVDVELGPHLFGYARAFQGMKYFRLDTRNSSGSQTLANVKAFLAAQIPVAFGFPFPSSGVVENTFFYRPEMDCPLGGQAVIAVGYDDTHLSASKGALLVRNSWGADWADNGYAWLPYQFVTEQLAADFWTILRKDWTDSAEFLCPWEFA